MYAEGRSGSCWHQYVPSLSHRTGGCDEKNVQLSLRRSLLQAYLTTPHLFTDQTACILFLDEGRPDRSTGLNDQDESTTRCRHLVSLAAHLHYLQLRMPFFHSTTQRDLIIFSGRLAMGACTHKFRRAGMFREADSCSPKVLHAGEPQGVHDPNATSKKSPSNTPTGRCW
jgi:hypothetical protein